MQQCQVSELYPMWIDKAEKEISLVDVRTLEEFNDGHVDGAQHIPLHLLPLRHEEISDDKPVYIICHSGMRSAQAAQWLGSQQRTQLMINVSGGMQAWQQMGYPVAS
ncbi:MAG: rhodanese-like domain-containing protein [Ghiorsea sp.]